MNVGQVLVNTLVWAGELGVIALGMSLSYSILGFANFAHIEFVTVGAYIAWACHRLIGLPIPLSALLAMLGTGLLALAIDLSVFRRLRQAPAATKMIASVGVAIFLRTFIQLLFSSQVKSFGLSWQTMPPLLGARFTLLQVVIVALTLASMLLFHLLMTRTRVGKALRATAQNFALAQARGIDGERMISLMWFLSGAFAALGGVLLGMETQLRPGLGLSIMLPMFAAATVGGLGNAYGAIAGAGILALAQNGILALDFGRLLPLETSVQIPTRYKDVIALAALVLTLLVRPSGVFGLKGR